MCFYVLADVFSLKSIRLYKAEVVILANYIFNDLTEIKTGLCVIVGVIFSKKCQPKDAVNSS